MSKSLFPQRPTQRALAVLVLHAVVFVAIYWLAFGIRTEFAISEPDWVTAVAVRCPASCC